MPENRHVTTARADVVASLDELQAVCPNLERVAVVVTWFGTDLRAGVCTVVPSIDNREKQTHGGTWSVAGITRAGARLVSYRDGRPAYGGTPSDESVLRLIAELKARGLKVTLYPFVMMDLPPGNGRADPWTGAPSQPAYPWRGHITCDPAPGRRGSPDGTAGAGAQVDAFFYGGSGYRNFILHYAALAAQAGGVDAFLLGSELKSLTRVRSASGVYPAVTALAALAADVKAWLGGALVTYGADWTEYGAHVVDAEAQEVRFPLDPLWASPAIDAIGIDYYPPLADWRDDAHHADRTLSASVHDISYLSGNLDGGEGFDWYYADDAARAAQQRTPITDGLGKPWTFRQKDIWSFWRNPHHERVGGVEQETPTAWVLQSKPVWITEVGCPAVDKGANQPNVFPDTKSSDGGLPHFSSGRRDDLMQRRYLEAVLRSFDPAASASEARNPLSAVYGGPMIDPSSVCLWTWDARPYPAFPAATDTWSDAVHWETGHWLTGRFGSAPLAGLVSAVLADAGIGDVGAAELGAGPDGYLIDRPMSPRAALDPLAAVYAFDAVEEGGVLRFRRRGGTAVAEIDETALVQPEDGAAFQLTRAQETELPREVSLGFTDGTADYRRAAAMSRRLVGGAARAVHSDVAMVADEAQARRQADIWLQDLWAGRENAEFVLPPSALALSPGDVVGFTAGTRRRLLEVREINDGEARAVRARSIDPEVFDLPLPPAVRRAPDLPAARGPVHALALDLPALDATEPPVLTRLAVFADPWPGPVAVLRSDDGLSFSRAALALAPAVAGETLEPLPQQRAGCFQHRPLRVVLYGGALASVSDGALLAGANLAALRRPDGAWEVLQFGIAELVGERTYALSRLLRGQGGTEWAMGDPLPEGAPLVLLDERVVPVARGLDMLDRPMSLRIVAAGHDEADSMAVSLTATPSATALRPLAPVHVAARRGSDGVRISCIRRARYDADTWSVEIPLGEAFERYEIDILSGDETVRTLSTQMPSALYAAADEIADFGAPQRQLALRVAQLSATVGRGVAAEAIVDITLPA